MKTSNFAFDVYCILGLESTFPDGWWMVGWVAGLAENIANSAQLKLELGLSLAIGVQEPTLAHGKWLKLLQSEKIRCILV